MPSVLIVGIDPLAMPGLDGAALRAALDQELERFGEHSVDASMLLIALDESAEPEYAAKAGKPLRVTETNSACASGAKNTCRAQPVYYGLLFTRLFATGGFLPVTLSAQPKAENFVAFADRSKGAGTDRVMLENMEPSAKITSLRLAGYTGSSVQVLHLTGGSPLATSWIKIQGASVAANGTLARARRTSSPASRVCAR